MKLLILYSRPGCHLCDCLEGELQPLLEGRAELRVVDVDRDVELKKRYGLRVPVLVGGKSELPAQPLDPVAVEAFLAA
jgi:hypothetical protein